MPTQMVPLAERARPATLDDIAGQAHIVGPTGIVRKMLDRKSLRSCIFYGSPGCGKTATARVLAKNANMPFVWLNATTASVTDIREATEVADQTLVYLDEIQYFNKKQQQSLLSFVEDGSIVLIAATTENPYHGIYKALLSRCLVIEFKPLTTGDIEARLTRVCQTLDPKVAIGTPGISPEALRRIAETSAGDMRRALNVCDAILATYDVCEPAPTDAITPATLDQMMPSNIMGSFDVDGDQHYRYKAALQKSIRGSDPDAAVFWLMQMLEGGDIVSPSRRMLVMASEDVGLADPYAVQVVLACVQAAERLGLPEARYPLAEAAIYLATAPKANSVGKAFSEAVRDIHAGHGTIVPEHIASEHPKDYIYPHDYPLHWCPQQYMPGDLVGKRYYQPQHNVQEQGRARYWAKVKGEKA